MSGAARGLLPYGRQCIEDDDVDAVVKVLRGDWLTTGPAVAQFEAALAGAVGAAHAVACSSGTAALHLACLAHDLGPGDVAIVPSVTFLATANAPALCGAHVVFADVDPASGLMTDDSFADALRRAPSARRRLVFPVHLAGQPGDLAAIRERADAVGATVVEDACHALGTTYGSGAYRVGDCAHAAAAAFSFHPVKTIAMGEGGAVTTNDTALAERMRRLRNHGMTRDPAAFVHADMAFDAQGAPNPWYYEMREPGFNYRASDIHCALGSSQLAKLDRFVARRRALAARYAAGLAALDGPLQPILRTPGVDAAWHLFVVLIDFAALGTTRAHFCRRLADRGVGTQVHYVPVHRQPFYDTGSGIETLPGADRYYARALSLPLFPAMADADVDHVCTALAETLAEASGG